MADAVKVAMIIGAVALIATGLVLYFSSYQTCVRAMVRNGSEPIRAEIYCRRPS